MPPPGVWSLTKQTATECPTSSSASRPGPHGARRRKARPRRPRRQLGGIVAPTGWGPHRHGREPPRRHQEPRDLRVPGQPGADPGPQGPRVDRLPNATCSGRRPGSSPATPSSSTTGCGSAPEAGARRLHRREPALRHRRGPPAAGTGHAERGRAPEVTCTTTASPPTTPPTGSATRTPTASCASGAWVSRRGGRQGPGNAASNDRHPGVPDQPLWHGRFAGDPAERSCWPSPSACPSTGAWRRRHRRLPRPRARPGRGGRSSPTLRRRHACRARHRSAASWRQASSPSSKPTRTSTPPSSAASPSSPGGRGQAAHRPEPQRPGRHRPPAVRERSAGDIAAWGSRFAARSCSTRADEARRRLPAGLHPPPAGPAGAAGPSPAGPRLGPGPRRRPPARRPPPARRVAPRRRRPGRLVAAARPRWRPTSASPVGSRTASMP